MWHSVTGFNLNRRLDTIRWSIVSRGSRLIYRLIILTHNITNQFISGILLLNHRLYEKNDYIEHEIRAYYIMMLEIYQILTGVIKGNLCFLLRWSMVCKNKLEILRAASISGAKAPPSNQYVQTTRVTFKSIPTVRASDFLSTDHL